MYATIYVQRVHMCNKHKYEKLNCTNYHTVKFLWSWIRWYISENKLKTISFLISDYFLLKKQVWVNLFYLHGYFVEENNLVHKGPDL